MLSIPFHCVLRLHEIDFNFHFFHSRARMLLRKKKYQEKLLDTTDQQLENLEKLTSDLEFALVEQKVLDGLKVGNEALKKVHEILTIDEIERVLDETAAGVEKQREIDAILNQYNESALTEDDEDQVLAELDELIKADKKNAEDVAGPVELPDVPSDEVVAEDEEEEEEAAVAAEVSTPKKSKKSTKEKSQPIALEA